MIEGGVRVKYSEIEELAGGEIVGRPHFARFLVARGIAKNTDDAFQRFLKRGMPFYVAKKGLSTREAADLVHLGGGKAIIAHPLSLYLGWKVLPERIKGFRDEGVDGLEAYHSNASMRDCRRLADIAADLGMIISAGSDFHGEHIPSRRIGRTSEGRPIEEYFALPYLEEPTRRNILA
jgi:predicted metal-dependent phosphoesterase TrpH